MIQNYSSYIKKFPELPGVYLMKDGDGLVIYVGKAIRLKTRVSSYFKGGDDRLQIETLLERVSEIDFIVTKDERQALVLEADLVKKYQPRFNVRLKDDRSALMIKVDRSELWPRVQLVRKKLNDNARYFGPFPFSYEARAIMEVIERAIPLRTCTDKILRNRVRPCLQYQINRCSGPCCLPVDEELYNAWVDQAISILEGNVSDVAENILSHMQRASSELRYEDAAILRDRLDVLKKLNSDVTQVMYGDNSIHSFGLYREGGNAEVTLLKTTNGRLSDSHTFGFNDVVVSNQELLSSAIYQFYLSYKSPIPEEILTSVDIQDEFLAFSLKQLFNVKVNVKHPERGLKSKLLALANTNAKENFEARFSSQSKNERVLSSMQSIFQLEQFPRIIECIDISHIQGRATVGAVVCFRDGKPDPSRYRFFHLSQEGKPDDFSSINEVVRRHLLRCVESCSEADLIIIDGGPPQLKQALKVRTELGLRAPALISIAKKRVPLGLAKRKNPRGQNIPKKPERVYCEDNPVAFILEPNNEILKFIERVRDETHNKVINFHRKTRTKLNYKSPLDQVLGLGPVKKSFLLKTFGSLEKIKQSTLEDLVIKGKLSKTVAKQVLKILQKI